MRERAVLARVRFALRGDDVAPPVALASGSSRSRSGLYLLQGTSPNASSIRYLIPVWVALPGLLASGLRALPGRDGALRGGSSWSSLGWRRRG